MSEEETPNETPREGRLVPRPDGRGALRQGGTNKGGPGRPPAKFREAARKLLHNRKLLPRLADIADGSIGEVVETKDGKVYTETPIREQRGAIEVLLKYGVGEDKPLTQEYVKEKLALTINAIYRLSPPALAEAIEDEMREIWK